MPKISVIMPTYNSVEYLTEAIDSILAQTFDDFEFLIVDDSSTDRTREVISSFRDRRIKIIDGPCKGLAAALNTGIDNASGEYIARMDSDDIAKPERFAKQVRFLDTNPRYGVCGTRSIRLVNGEEKGIYWSRHVEYPGLIDQLVCSVVLHPSVMWRRKTFLYYNLRYNEDFLTSEDHELWSRALRYTDFYNIQEPLMLYRISKTSASRAKLDACRESYSRVKYSILEYLFPSAVFDRDNLDVHIAQIVSVFLKNNPSDYREVMVRYLNLPKTEAAKVTQEINNTGKSSGSIWLRFKSLLKRFLPVPAKTHNDQIQALSFALAQIEQKIDSSNTGTRDEIRRVNSAANAIERKVLDLSITELEMLKSAFAVLRETLESSIMEKYVNTKEKLNESVISISSAISAIDNHIADNITTAEANVNSTITAMDNHIADNITAAEANVNSTITAMDKGITEKLHETQMATYNTRTEIINKTRRNIAKYVSTVFKQNSIRALSFHLVDHCNLNCKFCSNFSPLASDKSWFADKESFRADLERLYSLVGNGVEVIHLMGGEPLLHPHPEDFAVISRQIFKKSEIVIITNGLLAFNMWDNFWDTLRENNVGLQVSRYPVDFNYEDLEEYVKDKEVRFCLSGVNDFFVDLPLELYDVADKGKQYIQCRNLICTQLRSGHLYRCAQSAYSYLLNNALEAEGYEDRFTLRPTDSLDIYKAESAEDVWEFLSNPVPFCQYCNLDKINEKAKWSVSGKKVGEWVSI